MVGNEPLGAPDNLCNQALPGIHHFCIFSRPMTWIGLRARPISACLRSLQPSLFSIVLACLVSLGCLGGCDGLQARKWVQEGNFHYKQASFEEAKICFEKALALEPSLEIAHHNLGLTCAKLFKAGLDTPENTAFADCATHEIQIYLDRHPKENKLRDKMTGIWLNSGLYDKALTYWHDQFKVIPQDEGAEAQKREITQRIAGINFKSGRWREAMEWYAKAANLAPDGPAKVSSYQSVGNVAWATMRNREKNYGVERIEAADRGLDALEKAAELDPKRPEVRALIAALYNFRALAQGSPWAAAMERATAQDHDRRRRVLSEEAKKAQALANGTGATAPAPTNPPTTAKPGG
jgi:tetratricopeptide (TPR) repeat protein